jgi:predicted RNA-binding Zn-ribbon protein involved in translation (DUF1610 family)
MVASALIPSEEKIRNNQAPKYKSQKNLINILGILTLVGGVIILMLYISDSNYQQIIDLFYVAVLMGIGAAVIAQNRKKANLLKSCESAGFPQAALPGAVVTPQVIPQTQVVAQPTPQQVAAQQVGVKSQVVTAQQVPVQQVTQQQVAAQQVGIKAQPQVPAQPVAQPQAAQKPKIIVIKCPRCKGDMQIDTRMLGQKMKCPHCGIEGRIG